MNVSSVLSNASPQRGAKALAVRLRVEPIGRTRRDGLIAGHLGGYDGDIAAGIHLGPAVRAALTALLMRSTSRESFVLMVRLQLL